MPKFVGILNITPDSFSDGGLSGDIGSIIIAARRLISDGVDVIDIGAESTRPGATILTPAEEWQRLEPILPQICRLGKDAGVFTSIDTRHFQTAAKAIEAGVDWINDVSGAENPEMVRLLAGWHGKIVIMHNLGIPADKNITIPENKNPVQEVKNWLQDRLHVLEKTGISRSRVIIDPGIGFGKTAAQSWQLINNISDFKNLGAEIMVGHSRKSFLKCAPHTKPEERDAETQEVSQYLAGQGVDYLRVHVVLK